VNESSAGVKEYKNKVRWSLLPFDALESVVRVLEYGAHTKYAFDNWKRVREKGAYLDGILRHWAAYKEGEEIDNESKENHLANLVCDALFLLWDRQQSGDVPFDQYICGLINYPDYVQRVDPDKFKKE
jgi:hypothetical protein